MKNRKRISLFLAVLMLICALCGCSDKGGNTDGKTDDGNNALSLGIIEGNVYTNQYVGLSCKLGSNWTYKTAEELQDLPDDISNMMSGSALGDAISRYNTLIDMQAENLQDLTSINVVYTKLPSSERAMYAKMTESEVIDSILAQKDMLIASYKQMGITVHSMKKVTVTFMGEEHTAMHMTADISGIAYYTLQFSYMHLGEYGATVTLASYQTDKTDSLLPIFSKA